MAKLATREAFGAALAKVGESNENVVALDADLSCSTKSGIFGKKFPERFFQMGIAEANMIGTGAGLALSGKIPFICSFACFVTGRFDQIRISIAYSQANVRIIGTHAGVAIGDDGYSQMGLEDIALMRSLPAMSVVQPCDDIETEQLIEYLVEQHEGPVFVRLTRQKVERANADDYRFEFGKGVVLKEGTDITLLATGGVTYNALQAARELEDEGLSVKMVNIHTIKPIDKELLLECARSTGRFVTVEDHTVVGGFGSAVIEAIAQEYPVPVKRLGIQDIFGESGDPDELYEKHGLSVQKIKESVLHFMPAKVHA